MRINLNDNVCFIPTRAGALLWNQSGKKPWASPGQTMETHFWVLCYVLGPKMSMAGESLIEGLSVDMAEDAPSPPEEVDTLDSLHGNVVAAALADKIHLRMLEILGKVMDHRPTRDTRRILRVVAEELADIRILTRTS